MCFPVARCDRMAISMQWLLHNHFNRSWQSHCLERIISQKTDYELKSSNYYLISRFFHKKTDFVTQKTDFGKIFLLAHTKMLKTFDVVELRAKFLLHDTRTFYSNNKIAIFFILENQPVENPILNFSSGDFWGKRHLAINFHQKTLYFHKDTDSTIKISHHTWW